MLAELLTRWVQEHRDMSVSGLLQPEKLLEPALPMRGFQQIGAPDNMSEMGLRIINGRGQLVGIEAVPALHDKIFERSLGWRRLPPTKSVVKPR